MELEIINKEAKKTGKIKLPIQFQEKIREDLVKRAALAIQANKRQRYGANPEAGKRASAYVSKRRRNYKTTYGIGQSRTPRKVMSRSGTRFNWVGAFAPQTVGGRRSHPPKASKIWTQKINTQENRKAIRSAMSATMQKDLVKNKGHRMPETYPFILAEDFNDITKTAELKKILITLNFKEELERANTKKIRPGKGKLRGRKYKTRKSILFVIDKETNLIKTAANLQGCEVVTVNNLNAEVLAPGAQVGRLTLFTESAIKKIEQENLFTKITQKQTKKTETKKEKKETIKKTIKKATTKKATTKKATTKKATTKKATTKKTIKETTKKTKGDE